jgi:DNA helicase INO80
MQQGSPTYARMNGKLDRTPSVDGHAVLLPPPKPVEEVKPARADPMSFSSILSSTVADPPKTVAKQLAAQGRSRRLSKVTNGDAPSNTTVLTPSNTTARKSSRKSPASLTDDTVHEPIRPPPKPRGSKLKAKAVVTEKDAKSVAIALAEIESMEMSDLDAPSWAEPKKQFQQANLKRRLKLDEGEDVKRKVRLSITSAVNVESLN